MRALAARRVLPAAGRHPVLALTIACLAVLVLAQALIGALSLTALNRLMAQTTADRLEVGARRIAAEVQTGMRLGKPLAQYFGLQTLIDQTPRSKDSPTVHVVMLDGTVLARRGETARDLQAQAAPLLRSLAASGATRAKATAADALDAPVAMRSGAVMQTQGNDLMVAVALRDEARRPVGAVLLGVNRYGEAWQSLLLRNISVLLLVTGVIGLLLAAALTHLAGREGLAPGGRARYVLPLVAILLAQGIYAGFTLSTFRSVWVDVARENAATLAEGLQRDLNRVLGYGLDLNQLRDVQAPFERLQQVFPAMGQIELQRADGVALARTRLPEMGPVDDTPAALRLPLSGPQSTVPVGHLVVTLNAALINEGVRGRVIDALTVSAVAVVTAMEMLLVLALLTNRQGAPAMVDATRVGKLARPVMFAFLFAWALPLGFLPLYARTLPAGALDLPPNLLLALPISVEMLCGLITALIAGRLTDRRGWQVPVLSGLVLAATGMMLCSAASSLAAFVGARALVGLGYGLTWMGLQGFIVIHSPADARGRNMTGVIAGLFAGHLCGAAVGAMLAEQIGYAPVFLIGALMLGLPLLGIAILLRPYMERDAAPQQGQGLDALPQRATPQTGAASIRAPRAWRDTLTLLRTRDFALLLLGSIIPFSIAQVGLISYALPLYLEAKGAAASSVGRILMIYGLCVIYIGPLMGRWADRTENKKKWIVAGGLTGSAGLMVLYADGGVWAAAAAVLMLALASCMSGASQSPYMLSLPQVQHYGAAASTSVMRAADKLGQLAGPLIVGTLFGVVGMGVGVAATGLLYLLATLGFMLLARSSQRRDGSGTGGRHIDQR